MSRYLLINLIIISGPILLSFDKRVKFYRKAFLLFFSFISVGVPFIVWDALATSRGDWSFNAMYVGKTKFLGLPVEEILFFFTVLYATMFSYEVIRHYVFERRAEIQKRLFYILSAVFCLLGFIFIEKAYTSTVFLVTSFTLFMSVQCFYGLITSIYYWLFMGVSMVLFFGFNYILTSMPVVLYGDSAIIGARVLTIPVEDFFYNYSMLTLYLGVYYIMSNKEKKLKKKNKLADYFGGGY
ncbi:MAG: lycopene cyclase domain-containing protein [bacterium]|nr:lycopene cyclase domain-containing protein [bacterium]